MKKLILAAMILAVAGMNVQSAKAGDREWATVGRVLTGVAVGAVIVNALDCRPAYTSVSYGYSAPVCPPPARVVCAPRPVVYAPAPVVVYRTPVYYVPQRPVVRVNVAYNHGHGQHRSSGYQHRRW